jgi:hypothetical protein
MRPRTPLDVADAAALARIASLAAAILVSLRQPGRGVYESERQLRGWLNGDGIVYSSSDFGPASMLLDATKRIQRPAVTKNTPRRGWLSTAAPEAPETAEDSTPLETGAEQRIDTLAEAVETIPDVALEDLGRIAAKLSRMVHRDGTRLRHEVERFLAGMSRGIRVDQVLDCAVENRWLVNHGNSVSAGEVDPEWTLERDTSARYAVVS